MICKMKSRCCRVYLVLLLSWIGCANAESIDIGWDLNLINCDDFGSMSLTCEFMKVRLSSVLV